MVVLQILTSQLGDLGEIASRLISVSSPRSLATSATQVERDHALPKQSQVFKKLLETPRVKSARMRRVRLALPGVADQSIVAETTAVATHQQTLPHHTP